MNLFWLHNLGVCMEINYNIDNLFNKFYSGIPIYGIINATDSKSQYNKYCHGILFENWDLSSTILKYNFFFCNILLRYHSPF